MKSAPHLYPGIISVQGLLGNLRPDGADVSMSMRAAGKLEHRWEVGGDRDFWKSVRA